MKFFSQLSKLMFNPMNAYVIMGLFQWLTTSLIMPSDDMERECWLQMDFTGLNSKYMLTKVVSATPRKRLSHVYLCLSGEERIKEQRNNLVQYIYVINSLKNYYSLKTIQSYTFPNIFQNNQVSVFPMVWFCLRNWIFPFKFKYIFLITPGFR